MSKKVRILDTQMTTNGEHIQLQAVTYQGSEPFAGIFSVFDIDSSMRTDAATGKIFIDVICRAGADDVREDPELTLELVSDPVSAVGIMGGGVEVVTRIAVD